MVTFADIVAKAAEIGIFTHYLPFLIVFAVFYAILQKTKIFGEKKGISALIAGVAALYVMTMGGTLGYFLASLFSGASVAIVGILVFLLIVGLVVGPKAWESFSQGKALGGLILFGLIVAATLFVLAGGLEILGIAIPGGPQLPSNIQIDTDTLIILGVLIFTVLVIWWMIGGGEAKIKGIKILPEI